MYTDKVEEANALYICGGEIPTLTGPRVELRAMTSEHAPPLYRIWQHPQVVPWLDMPPLASVEEAAALIELLSLMSREEEALRWSIVGLEGEVIGSCGYNSWQLPGAYRGEIGCELSPALWGQGFMREALELALDFGIGHMGLNRIEALCHPGNVRAGRLFTSLGFRQEGLLREYRHTEAGFQDVIMYALLRSDK